MTVDLAKAALLDYHSSYPALHDARLVDQARLEFCAEWSQEVTWVHQVPRIDVLQAELVEDRVNTVFLECGVDGYTHALSTENAVMRPIGEFNGNRQTHVWTRVGVASINRFYKHQFITKNFQDSKKRREYVADDNTGVLGVLPFPSTMMGASDENPPRRAHPFIVAAVEHGVIAQALMIREALMHHLGISVEGLAELDHLTGLCTLEMKKKIEASTKTERTMLYDTYFMGVLHLSNEEMEERTDLMLRMCMSVLEPEGQNAASPRRSHFPDEHFGDDFDLASADAMTIARLVAIKLAIRIAPRWRVLLQQAFEPLSWKCRFVSILCPGVSLPTITRRTRMALESLVDLEAKGRARKPKHVARYDPHDREFYITLRGSHRLDTAMPLMVSTAAVRVEDPTDFVNTDIEVCTCASYPDCRHGTGCLVVDGIPTIHEVTQAAALVSRTLGNGYRTIEVAGQSYSVNTGYGKITGWVEKGGFTSFRGLKILITGKSVMHPAYVVEYGDMRYTSFPGMALYVRERVAEILVTQTMFSTILGIALKLLFTTLFPAIAIPIAVGGAVVGMVVCNVGHHIRCKKPATELVDFAIARPMLTEAAMELAPGQDEAVALVANKTMLQGHAGPVMAQMLARVLDVPASQPRCMTNVEDLVSIVNDSKGVRSTHALFTHA
jgi:hypothetical protein